MTSVNWSVFLQEWARGLKRNPNQLFRSWTPYTCTVCNYSGHFIDAGSRPEARCPNCASKERDRIFQLYMRQNALNLRGKKVLHFSPERPFWRQWRNEPGYISADVKKSKKANAFVDITDIAYPDATFDVIICHHVLEHVAADRKGMAECLRVLKPSGVAFFSVPIDEARDVTFEPPGGMPPEEIERICGWDHKRLYGLDFADRLYEAGFDVAEIGFTEDEAQRHKLRGENQDCSISVDRIYVARKQQIEQRLAA